MVITILLVDDHKLFRKGLRLILEEEEDMCIVGEAGDGQEAINKVAELSPDVVVMDITMPNLNGIEATRQILAESPNTKIVALSIHSGKQFVQDMLAAGAAGYILKDSVPEELSMSIRKVTQGEVVLSNAITEVVVSDYVTLLSSDGTSNPKSTDIEEASGVILSPILKTKLYRPRSTADYVHRQRLIGKLNHSIGLSLTVVVAPAGYGKSTLVSQWLESCELKGAWFSLDDNDNDLRQFFSYLVLAIGELFQEHFHESEALLKLEEMPSAEILVRQLISDINTIDQRFVLVLDDYHLIQNRVVHDFLDGLIKYPPRRMNLVLVSRVDPPLPITKMRANGQMAEIRVRDLCFSRQEITEFLQQILETTIDENIISKLEEKTEGWITGLRLATLSMNNADDIERVVANMPEANRYILDYFVEEILTRQSTTMQDYLLATSNLNRFCGSLCDAIFISDTALTQGGGSGHEFLQLLKKANLFVIRLDDEGRWFRYHHLFKNLLQRRIKHRYKQEDVDGIHIKASTWFEENSLFEEAIQHALKGGDVERASEIVGRARHDLMNREQWRRLEQWLKLFSHEVVLQHPNLVVLRCWLDYYHWYRLDSLVKDLGQADLLLETSALDAHEACSLKAEVAAMRSNLAYWLLDPSNGVALAEQALRDSPDGHECTRSTAVFGWGPLCQMLGDAKLGERILWDHMEGGRYKHSSSQSRLMLSLCIILWPEAKTRKLHQSASKLLQISSKNELSWNHSFACYFLGLAHYERNELTEAVAHLEIIVGAPHRYPIQNVTHCSFLLSLSYLALGLSDKAREVAASIAKLTFERGNQMFIDLSEAFLADLDLREGRTAHADQWASGFNAPPPHGMQRFFNAELTFFKIMIARNTSQGLEVVAEQLDSMYKLLGKIHHRRLMVDVLGMQALVADAQGQAPTAIERLSEALSLAEPGGLVRPLLDLGYKMGELLKTLTDQKGDQKYAVKILAAFKNEETGMTLSHSEDQSVDQLSLSNQALVDPLTKREIEILIILSKRFSNPEIAEKLFISPETVKRHLYNIYQKFGVENRQQAIAKARSLGML